MLAWLSAAAALPLQEGARAEAVDGPVRLILPLPAGGAVDSAARLVAEALAQRIGQPVVVDNRPGADGAIATAAVIAARADGRTLLFATNTAICAVPTLRKKPPYDPLVDLTPVAGVGSLQALLLAHRSVPVRNVADFIHYVRTRPGALAFGTANSSGLLALHQIQREAGLQMLNVPYKGDAPALADLLGGRLQFMLASPGAPLPHIQAGTLRALAVLAPSRLALLPEVPTLTEAGLRNVSVTAWIGLYGPARMPRELVEPLSRHVQAVLDANELQARLAQYGIGVRPQGPEALAAFTREQVGTWRDEIRAAGIAQE